MLLANLIDQADLLRRYLSCAPFEHRPCLVRTPSFGQAWKGFDNVGSQSDA